MIKAFIFDIGGVLVRNDEALLEAIELALKENNVKLTDRHTVKHVFGRSNYINVKTAVKISYKGEDLHNKIEACYRSFKNTFPKKVVHKFRLFPHVLETLELFKSKGIKLAVFTGLNKIEAKHSLEDLGIDHFFEFVITVDDVKKPRPDPEAILQAIRRLGIRKEECIYVGDAIVDIHMAKNAKIRIVCVKTGVQNNRILAKEKPDFFVSDFSEMVQKLSSELPK